MKKYLSLGLAALALIGQPAWATSGTWNGSTSNVWGVGTNWSSGAAPGSADTATFSATNGGNTTISMTPATGTATISVASFAFDNTSPTYTIGSGGVGAQTFVLNNGNVSDASLNNQTFNANITLGSALVGTDTITNSGTGLITFAGNMTGGTGGSAGLKTLAFAGSGNAAVSGVIASGGASSFALTKSGAGTLTLSGANTYTGTNSLSAGTLAITGSGTLGNTTNALTITGGTFDLGGTSQTVGVATISGTTTIQNGTFTAASYAVQPSATTVTISASLAGSGLLTKSGSGTLVLSGNNSGFSGGVSLSQNGALLDIASATALGTGTFSFANNTSFDNTSTGSMTLTTNNTIAANGSVTFVGTHDLNLGTGNFIIGTNHPAFTVSAGTLTIGGNITNTTGSAFTKGGAGSLALTGDNSAYTLGIALSAGTLDINSATALGTGTLSIASGASIDNTSSGAVTITQVTPESWNNFTFVGTHDLNLGTGAVALATSTTVTVANGTLTVGGIISGSSLNLTKAGTGTLAVSGASTFTGNGGSGGLFISGGTLLVNSSVAASGASAVGAGNLILGDAGTTTNNSNSTLLTGSGVTIARAVSVSSNATTGTYTIGGATNSNSTYSGLITTASNLSISQVATTGTNVLSITGGIKGSGATAKTVTFANTGAVTVSSGAIADGTTGSLAITQSGAGTTTLAAGNTYTGATTINAGTLRVTGSIAAGSAVGINSGGTLAGTGTIFGTVTDNSGGSINLADGAIGTLTVGGLSTNGGTGTLTFEIGNNTVNSIDKITDSGTLSIGSGTTISIANILGSTGQTLAAGNYTLLTYTGTASGLNNLSLSSSTLDGFNLSLSTTTNGQVILVVAAGGVTDTGTDYYNGSSADLTKAASFDTGPATGTATPSAPSASSNLFFSSNANTATSGTVGSNLEVNSINFGTGGTKSTFAISGTGTITVDAAGVNGNTAGSGITIASGGGSASIANAVVLGRDESFAPADASSVLTVSGQVSGAHQLTKSGAGTVILSNGAGNSYSNGTAVTSGRLLVTNTTGSGTGSGTVSVTGNTAILGGSGKIAGAITLSSGGMLYSGATASAVTTGPGTGAVNGTSGGMTLSSALNVNGGTLSFALANSGTATNTLALSTSYITTTGSVNFTGTDTIDLVDTTNGGLSLRMGQSYLLISAGSNSAFTGLVTLGANGQLSLDGNGTVLGVWAGGTNALTDYTKITINEFGADGVSTLANGTTADPGYYQPTLVLFNGDLEVVPEPGTWALMIGGLALLVVIQRRRSNKLG